MKKKLLSVLCVSMAIATAVPLTACGGNSNGPTINEDGTWWQTTGELNKDGDKIFFDDISLRLNTIVSGKDKAAFEQLIDEFNAEYMGQINIKSDSIGEGDFETTVTNNINLGSNVAPDIIMTHQRSLKSFINYKVIQPYDVAMNATGVNIDLTAFAAGVNQYSKAGTEWQFGVPVDAASMVVYYNADLLDDYTQTVPTTRAEILKVCDDYKKATGKPAISWETSGDFFSKYLMPTAVLQNGGHLYKEDLYGDWYDDPTQREVFKTAIQSVRSFITSGYAEKGVHENGGVGSFINNNAIFYVTMPWYRQELIKGYADQNKITSEASEAKLGGASVQGWFAVNDPDSDNAKKVYGDSHMFAISRKVTDINEKAAICEFVKWFTQRPEVGAKWAEAGHVTLSNTIANSAVYKENKSVVKFIDKWYPDIDGFTTMGVTPYYGDVSENLSSLLSKAILKGDSSQDEELIRTAQQALNSQIDLLKAMEG